MDQINTTRRTKLADLTKTYWHAIEERGDPISTGIKCLDNALGGGFYPGRLIALLGIPGSGKTALANQIAEHIASGAHPVVYLTLEESQHTLLAKTISRIGGIDYGAVLKGSPDGRDGINEALTTISERDSGEYLTYIEDEGTITLETLRNEARDHFGDRTGRLIVVDYLQCWARAQRASEQDRRDLKEVVATQGKLLRNLAVELNCTVLMLASQNRANYRDGDVLSSAKESGDIEYDCDVLMAIGPSPNQKSATEDGRPYTLYIAKNRLGEKDKPLALVWRGNRQEMYDPHGVTDSNGAWTKSTRRRGSKIEVAE